MNLEPLIEPTFWVTLLWVAGLAISAIVAGILHHTADDEGDYYWVFWPLFLKSAGWVTVVAIVVLIMNLFITYYGGYS